MLDLSLPRGTQSARLLLDFAAARGISATRCLDRTGLKPDDFDAGLPEIATVQELRIIENLVEALPDPVLGLKVGISHPLRMYGIYGFALLSAATAREAVELAIRYQDLSFTLARASLARDPPYTHMNLDTRHLPKGIRAFVLDQALAIVAGTWREIDPRGASTHICLPADRAPRADAYRAALGLTPTFDGPSRVSFADRDLDRPRVGVDRRALANAERQCLELLRERQGKRGISRIIRARLDDRDTRPPSMEQLAAELHLSVRTLRRALVAEGTSFRELIRDSRQRRASAMLHAGCSVTETAERLGYHDPAAFINAYKRWHGTTPGRGH